MSARRDWTEAQARAWLERWEVNDREAALAMLRERFPQSEEWVVTLERLAVSCGARCQQGGVRAADLGPTFLTAAQALIASWDAATHADKVRALVEAARYERDHGGTCHKDCDDADLGGRCDLCNALAALPASLRGKP